MRSYDSYIISALYLATVGEFHDQLVQIVNLFQNQRGQTIVKDYLGKMKNSPRVYNQQERIVESCLAPRQRTLESKF